jgi:choline dehydrogenase-like flavoprotein
MRSHAYERGTEVHEAAGARRVNRVVPYPSTHNLGTARMSERPEDGVVDRWGRAHDVPNLFVSDGSVMTTGGSANPTLTIVALAIRQGEHIAREISAGAL